MNTRRLFVIYLVFGILPQTRCYRLKRALLQWCGAEIGQNVRIVSSARFYVQGRLVIGEDVWIGHQVLVVGGTAEVRIGARVDIAPRVMLVTGTHALFSQSDRAAGPGYSQPITVEDGAWLGAGALVIGGITVGSRSMIAAGAVVTKSVAPCTVVAGVPAKVIKMHEEENQCRIAGRHSGRERTESGES